VILSPKCIKIFLKIEQKCYQFLGSQIVDIDKNITFLSPKIIHFQQTQLDFFVITFCKTLMKVLFILSQFRKSLWKRLLRICVESLRCLSTYWGVNPSSLFRKMFTNSQAHLWKLLVISALAVIFSAIKWQKCDTLVKNFVKKCS
jgi:hypothetical protein